MKSTRMAERAEKTRESKRSKVSQESQGSQESKQSLKKQEKTVEVLYQKMGDRWFAFSLIDDEVYVGSIPLSEIQAEKEAPRKAKKLVGNS